MKFNITCCSCINAIGHNGISCETLLLILIHVKHMVKVNKLHQWESLSLAINTCSSYFLFSVECRCETIKNLA